MSDPYARLLAKLEELDLYSHQAVQQFPRVERHALVADIRARVDDLLRLTITAWKAYGKQEKQRALRRLDVEIEGVRHRIRKAHALRYLSDHRYGVWAGHLTEVGRMVGAWLNNYR